MIRDGGRSDLGRVYLDLNTFNFIGPRFRPISDLLGLERWDLNPDVVRLAGVLVLNVSWLVFALKIIFSHVPT